MGVELRDMGIDVNYAPIIKRAAHRLADGRGVIVAVDTNLASESGDDTTGVAKIYVYISSDDTRTSYSVACTYTPASVPATATRAFVGSSCLRENNNLYVTYQAADNSLRNITFTLSGSTYTATGEQTVIAANAVTSRFRAVDIDAAPSNGNLAIIVYESLASSGMGMWIRVYVRMSDGTTWTKAWEHNQFTAQFIKPGAEDVAISWNAAGVSANVGDFAIYYTWTSTTVDNGDYIRHISFNVVTGTTNTGTLLGSWTTTLNKSIASGSRRGWLYQEDSGRWMFATSVGTTIPQFTGARISASSYTMPTLNKTSVAIQAQLFGRKLQIMRLFGPSMSGVATDYCDGRLLFGIAGVGTGYSAQYMARVIVMRFDEDDVTNLSALSIDTQSRPLDRGYFQNGSTYVGVVALYGGGAKYNMAGLYKYNFAVIYGGAGFNNKVRAVTEDTYTAPVITAPVTNPATDTPLLQASFQDQSVHSNLKGKLQFEWSTSSDFSTDLVTVTQDDSEFASYSSPNGYIAPTRVINLTFPEGTELFGAFWFGRARMLDDLGNAGAWSTVLADFELEHPPTALAINPRQSAAIPWVTGDVVFSWRFTDTEPTDSQTAYQVVVVRNDTGAVVQDTGKISSSEAQASIDLADTLRGIPLQWTVALWDEDDNQGPFSDPNLFTVMDNPVALIVSPADGDTLSTAIPTVQWTFVADNDRTQRAYRVVVLDVDNGNTIVGDSGWIVSPETTYTFDTNILTNATNYYIYVEVQDSLGMYGASNALVNGNYDFESNARGWTGTDATLSQSSTYAVSGTHSLKVVPAGGATEPTATSDFFPVQESVDYTFSAWLYFPSAFAGDVNFEIVRYNSSGIETGSSAALESGASFTPGTWTKVDFSSGSFSVGTVYAAVRIYLDNTAVAGDVFYIDYVEARLSDVVIDTDWIEPAQPTASVSYDELKATISWTDAAIDAEFVGYRVYRKYMEVASSDFDINNTDTTWVLIHETNENEPTLSYNDYLVPLNRAVSYTVVQVVDRFGSLIESEISSVATVTVPGDRYYFVPLNGIGSIASFEATSVTADSFVREVEQEAIHVVGRGKQVQIGDDLGYSGTLSIHLRSFANSRRDREFFEYISVNNDGYIYIKSPFGDVFLLSIGSVSTQRIPGIGGGSDMADLTVPYQQVFGALPVTRSA